MLDKSKLTEKLVELLPPAHQVSVEQAAVSWWHNIRDTGGFRLTKTGLDALQKHLKLECYDLELDRDVFTPQLLLKMDRKISCPYYVNTRTQKKQHKIVFFGGKEAMMVNLYGSFNDWLDNCEFRYNGPGS